MKTYKIVKRSARVFLERSINEHLEDWELIGGPFTCDGDWCQAVMKYDGITMPPDLEEHDGFIEKC